ncbi:MAG: hypothetical protein ACRDDY_03185 [Clostridium sp.]|uniref:hypothetical protein n=1 Tax=Clostridium sp. TaxID=1506 RepID=UPI003EE7756D
MGKRNKIIVASSISILVTLALSIRVFMKEEYKIIIQNDTNNVITNLELKYIKGEIIKEKLMVNGNEKIEYTLSTKNLEGKNVVLLSYKDKNGMMQEEIIIGYLEKGYGGKVHVTIEKIDSDGKLDMKIKNVY